MTALAGHKLSWKHRAELLGQLSSVMKFMWLSLCLQAVCYGHPADSSMCSGKAHQPRCAAHEVCARWLEWSLLLPTFLPHVSFKELSPVQSGFSGSSLPSWHMMVSTQQRLKCGWRIHQCPRGMEGLSGNTRQRNPDCYTWSIGTGAYLSDDNWNKAHKENQFASEYTSVLF